MNRLSSVIGLAPSELSLSTFREKLTLERNRVRESLEEFRLRRMGKSSRKPSKPKGIAASLKNAGLSKDDFLKGIELLKKMEGEKNA
jgi:hypothetical protein